MQHPIHIVMTPVRNEDWVLRAFLSATSLWADYIIIADQMSTDESRAICKDFPKVIVIDNNNPQFNEAERQSMLVKKAREVSAGRDTILWGLDADEILPANWQDTEDGKHILNSVPGDVFWFKWAQICPDKQHYDDSPYYPWLFHDDGVEPHGNYERNMHSMRIPYPIEEKQMYYVKDFRVLHCGLLNPYRTAAKNRFYQFVDWEMNHRSPASLSAGYFGHRIENQNYEFSFALEQESINFPFDLWTLIDTNSTHTWFDDYVYEHIDKYPKEIMRKLDIWDEDFVKYYGIRDARRLLDKMIHKYFHLVNSGKSRNIIQRAVYKMVKVLY